MQPIVSHRFKHMVGAQDIGLNEINGCVDGAVDMRLGREIDHRSGSMDRQESIHDLSVGHVCVNKDVPWIVQGKL